MNTPNPLTHSRFDTPLGEILIWASTQHLQGAWFLDQPNMNPLALQCPKAIHHPLHVAARDWMESYFCKSKISAFELALPFEHASPFQLKTWQALNELQWGEKISYSELAKSMGCPNSTRAVASAVAKNPLIIFLPCHRVIGSDGSLKGYSAGLGRKKFLLELEQAA